MDFQKSRKLLLRIAALYFLLAALVFFAAGDGFRREFVSGTMLSPGSVIGEIIDGTVVRQRIAISADDVEALDVEMETFGRRNTGILHLDILAADGSVIAGLQENIEEMRDHDIVHFPIPEGISGRKGQYTTLQIWSEGCTPGNAVSVYYGDSVRAGKYDVPKAIDPDDLYSVNGRTGRGTLCACLSGYNELVFYKLYWPAVLLLFVASATVMRFWWIQAKRGRQNPLTMLCTMMIRYGFLIRQLVSRDFKVKYKRSILGVGWSFLNPLLTMLVQYIVFSRLFSSGTKNYPVYLLTGIVFFNFFNEAVTMGMTAITGNAALIKKVYLPKYVFPLSKVLSTLINLGTSMIPLVIIMVLTGLRPGLSLLLLVFDILCLILFVLGMTLLLCTSMTFFQDTLFLWRVVSMIWMYLTPIFYIDVIIPEKIIGLYHLNPLYQYINFARICMIDGVSPAPAAYLWCLLSALAVFVLGVHVFRKYQDRFVLYL